MNAVFLVLIAGAVLAAAYGGRMQAVTDAGIAGAKQAIELVIGLIGQMALWLGFMRVLRDAGVMGAIARGIGPAMRRLFPEVPADHPAMGAMVMNLAANVLGLGNAATPFGLKAMKELDRLNPRPGVATDAMALFLAINTSGVAVLPLGAIALRASLGAERTADIVMPTLLATAANTVLAVIAARWLARRGYFAAERFAAAAVATPAGAASLADGIAGIEEAETIAAEGAPADRTRMGAVALAALALVAALVLHVARAETGGFELARELLSSWLLPVLMAGIVLFGFGHRVRVYESFIRGAREGFDIAVMIIPFLVAILVSIGMFRASGLMDLLIAAARPATDLVGFPAEALPMALVRPLSGSGALGVMSETMTTYGPDSFTGFLVCVMAGSSETTFYVLALYFGSVGVRAIRHTLLACVVADLSGVAAAYAFSRLFY
jgi:spore maturation protein SpmA